MAFINNILGSGGFNTPALGNLTSGLEALQRTEIANKLQSLQQQKAWDRDEKMRNEAFALEMALPKIIEDRRIGLAQETAQKADEFTKKLTEVTRKAQTEGRGLSLAEKIALKTERGVLLNESERAKAFIDALEEGQKFHLQTLQKLDPTQKDEYMRNWSTLYSKMKDPNASKTLSASDVMTALQPPEPTSSMVFAQTTKDLLPFIDNAVKAEANGKTSVDFNVLKKVIASNVDQNSYLYQKGVQEGRWNNVDEMYNQMAERIAPSIKTDVVGWKPNEPTEKEKFGGFGGTYKSAVSGENVSNSYIFDQWGTPIETSFTLPDGRVTSAKMTPLAIKPNSKLEAEFTVTQRVISDPMSQGQALFLKQQTGGTVLPKDENGMYSVSYNQPTKYTDEVQLSPDAIEKIKRRDPNAAKYIGELEPYPTRVGKQETSQKQNITESEYAKLKKGDTFFFNGKEHKKQ